MARNFLASRSRTDKGNLHAYYLPRGIVSLRVRRVAGARPGFRLEVPGVEIAPDPARLYHFHYAPSAFAHDNIAVTFFENGLLRSISTTIDDQRGEFIKEAISLGTALARVVAVPGVRTRGGLEAEALPDVVFDGKIDPFDAGDLSTLNAVLQAADPTLRFDAQILNDPDRPGDVHAGTADRSGVYCRIPALAALTLRHGDQTETFTAPLPHPYRVQFIEIPQGSWVKNNFNIEFGAIGYPVKIAFDKPSSAIQIIRLPIILLNAILEIPASLFQFRINLDTARLGAQQSHLDLQKRMDEMQKQLQAAEQPTVRGTQPQQTVPQGSQPASGGAADDRDSETERLIKKLQQDLDIMRKRLNKLDE
ncbi:MAG: hypothetical protein OHK0039_22400 [Bacteroidia bacterium]